MEDQHHQLPYLPQLNLWAAKGVPCEAVEAEMQAFSVAEEGFQCATQQAQMHP